MARKSKDNPYGITAKQQLFCEFYIKNFNATQSYINVYGGNYNNASKNSYRLMGNDGIRKEIKRLQKIDEKSLVDKKTVLKRIVKIAFSDIGNCVDVDKQCMLIKKWEEIDTSLISEISQTKEGIKIKLIDQKWALNFLIRYFGLDPDSTHQKRYLDKKIELEEKKIDSDKNVDELKETITNFLESTRPTKKSVIDVFSDNVNEDD